MAVTTLYVGNDPDAAEGIARGIEATGGRAIAAHWFGEHSVFSFKGMSESEIDAFLDREFDRLDALKAAGARS